MRIRVVEDDELPAYVAVWNAIPGDAEPVDVAQQRERRARDPRRLYVLAELDGIVVGCGFAGPSASEGRGFLAPRVLPEARGRGVGTALLDALTHHLTSVGFETASAHVDGADESAIVFARRHGYEEIDRQVEQVRLISATETPGVPPPGVVHVSLAERPELLRESYDLACEGYADLATTVPVSITLEDWLDGDGGNVPEGSFVALADGEIIGFSGLCRLPDDTFEDGLCVVRRAWRGRGVAAALKRDKIAWAAANGITEIVTWTQNGNESMQALNRHLGYVDRSVSITVRAPLGGHGS